MDNRSLLDSTAHIDLRSRICDESKKIWRVALPGIMTRVMSFGIIVVTQSVIGHISSLDLAGYALVQTLTVRFAKGILVGMSSATETLCAQAFGAKQYHMVGIYLQRSWLINVATLTLLLPIFVFATPMFIVLGQDEAILRSAGLISVWFILHLYSVIFTASIQRFLQAQQRNMITAGLSSLQFVIHVCLSWLFINFLSWGVNGAMAALSLSSWLLVFGEFIYVFGGWCPDTWKGFSFAAFKDLLPVVKLSVSSGVMLCLVILTWEFNVSLGMLGAAVVRVANELGRGDPKATKFSIKVLSSTSLIIAMFFWLLCLLFGDKIGYLFTNDEQVARTVSDLSLLLAFSILLNGVFPVLSGVAVGAGLQTKVAVINLVCYYVIGIPIGVVLGYVFQLQVKGIWVGMLSGVVAQTLAICLMTWKTNWDEEVSKTSVRLGRWYLESSNGNNECLNHDSAKRSERN